MFYIDADVNEWAAKLGMKSKNEKPCEACGAEDVLGRPFRSKEFSGIEFKCPCAGKYSMTMVFVPTSDKSKKEWDEILNHFCGEPRDDSQTD